MGEATPKVGTSASGAIMHYSVGAVISRDGKYLIVDRVKIPLGHAGIAGHVDKGEQPADAIRRETEEECGLSVIGTPRLLFSEEINNPCSKGVGVHFWFLYEVEVAEGNVRLEQGKAKSIGWFTPEEIRSLQLEPIWEYWFRKLGVIVEASDSR